MTPLNIMALCSYSNDPVPEISFFVLFKRRKKKTKQESISTILELIPGIQEEQRIYENIEQKKTPSPSGPNEINIKGNHTIPEPGNMYGRTVEEKKTGLMLGPVKGMKG